MKEILAEGPRATPKRQAGYPDDGGTGIGGDAAAPVADIERAGITPGGIVRLCVQNVIQATEQVVGRSLNGADQERLVREAWPNLDCVRIDRTSPHCKPGFRPFESLACAAG